MELGIGHGVAGVQQGAGPYSPPGDGGGCGQVVEGILVLFRGGSGPEDDLFREAGALLFPAALLLGRGRQIGNHF